MIEDHTEVSAKKIAGATLDNHIDSEFSMREAAVTIEIEGGMLRDVTGLPHGWLYRLADFDVCPDCGGVDDECELCRDYS